MYPEPPKYTRSGQYRIAYQDAGTGDVVLLAHGWGSSASGNWMDTGWFAALSARHRVLALDVRGHGDSDKPHDAAAYSYAAMSEDVLAVIDAEGIERCDFVGYSMGAFMGAWLIGNHSSRIRRAVLGGIGKETDASAAQGAAIAAALRSTDTPTAPALRAVRSFVEADTRNDLLALAASAERMWPDGDPLRLLGAGPPYPSVPVLVVNGSDDRPYVDTADAFLAALPNARELRIPGEDHLGTVTSPTFLAEALHFLSES